MTHIRSLSRTPEIAQTDALESKVILILTLFFNQWDNFRPVVSNLQKFFASTP